MNRAEKRSQKRKEVVEAVTLRKEPVELVARVYNIPLRTVFDWLARYRQGGWHALIEKTRQGRPKKITGDDMKWLYDAITMGNPLNYTLVLEQYTRLATKRTRIYFVEKLDLSPSGAPGFNTTETAV